MIKTVYFDLGNVLIFVNFPKLLYGLENLSGLSSEKIQSFLNGSNLRERYEKGLLTTQDFCFSLQKRAKKGFSLDEFKIAFSDIFTPNIEVWSTVEDLKKRGVRLVLLSNTSQCHFEYAKKHYPVLNLFDYHILSYEVGAWKPDPHIFKKALQIANCEPEECFYTDDIPEFIESARNIGLPGEVFRDASSLKEQLQSRGLRFK